MKYLYENNFEHRDLKATNCLLVGDTRVKLADFGLARRSGPNEDKQDSDKADNAAGTPSHMALELLLKNKFTEKCDVYSFGIVIFEVLSRAVPYAGLQPEQIIAQLIMGRRPSPIPEDSPPQLVTLMEKCWHQEPFLRPEFKEVVWQMKSAATSIIPEEKGGPRCMLISRSSHTHTFILHALTQRRVPWRRKWARRVGFQTIFRMRENLEANFQSKVDLFHFTVTVALRI